MATEGPDHRAAERPRNALAFGSLGAVALGVIGLIVGFVSRSTTSFGGANCGSVLGGGGDELTAAGMAACERAMSTPVTWTWLLLVAAALFLIVGLILNAIQNSRQVG